MFRIFEREDGSTAIFDRSTGRLLSVIQNKRSSDSTSSPTNSTTTQCTNETPGPSRFRNVTLSSSTTAACSAKRSLSPDDSMRRSTRFRTVGKISSSNEVKNLSHDLPSNSFHTSSESDSGRRLRPRNLLPDYCEDKLIERTVAPAERVTATSSVSNKVNSNSSKLKKPENHLIVVFKPSSNSDSSSFIPNRMRLLPSAALDKLHSELFPQKCSKTDDFIGNNSNSLVSTSSSSVGQTGLRRISSRRQQQLQRQANDNHFTSSSSFSNMSTVNGSNGKKNVRSKLGQNLPRDSKEPALHEMDTNTYARYLNLIPKDTYNQVPMVDLKKSWPLRNQSRTQTPTRLLNHPRHLSHQSQMTRRSDQTIRLTSKTGSLGKPLQVINLKNGSFGSIPNSGAKQASSDLTRTELDRKQWLDCLKTKEMFVHSQKKPHVVIQQKANGMLVMKPLMGSTHVTSESRESTSTSSCTASTSVLTSSSRRIPNMHEQFFKELNHLLPYTGPYGNVHSSEDRKMLSRFIQKYQLKPAAKCRLGLELTSILGRRILEVYSYLTEIKSGIQMYRLIRLYEKYCSTNLSMHRDLLRVLKNTSGKFKIEFKIPSPLQQNCSTRLLRSCDVINKYTAAWGLNCYHLYTFSKQERLEKNLTLTTGLDWKGRLMAIGCDRIPSSQLFSGSIPMIRCTICKGKINPDLGHSCRSISRNQSVSADSPSSSSAPSSPGNVHRSSSSRSTRNSNRKQSHESIDKSSHRHHHYRHHVSSTINSSDFIANDQSIQIPSCGYTPIRSNVTAKTISAAFASGSLSALFCDTGADSLDSTHQTCRQDTRTSVTGTHEGRMTLRAGPRQGQQMSTSHISTDQLLAPLSKFMSTSSCELMKLDSESESSDEIILHPSHEQDDIDNDDEERDDDEDDEEEELVLIGPNSVTCTSNSQISSGNSTSSSHLNSNNYLTSGNNGNIEVLIEF